MTNYTSDNGAIAFGDPFELIKRKEAKIEADRVRNKINKAKYKAKGDIKARKEMHTKFG